MFLIIAVASILTVCSGNSSNRAISHQHFIRYDVPLSYNFTAVHAHEADKRDLNNIQYAPLILRPKEATHTTEYVENEEVTTRYEKIKSNLQPQDVKEEINYRPNVGIPYVPGYNYQLPSHRNIEEYRAFEDNYQKKNLHSQRNLSPNRPRLEEESLPQAPVYENPKNFPYKQHTEPRDTKNPIDSANYQIYQNDKRYINTLPALESENIQPYVMVKTPRLHLNVARSYHFAQGSIQAPEHVNDFRLRIKAQHNIPELKTYLQPIPNNYVHFLHRIP